jgi:hypothetical protein
MLDEITVTTGSRVSNMDRDALVVQSCPKPRMHDPSEVKSRLMRIVVQDHNRGERFWLHFIAT